MKKTFKLGATLGIYAAVSCLCLAVVNSFTAPVIKEHEIQKENEGLRIVCPQASKFIPVEKAEIDSALSSVNEKFGSIAIVGMYRAVDSNNQDLGYIAKIKGPTYETTSLLLGLDLEQKITGVHILSTIDSPGYGQKAVDPKFSTSKGKTFYGQFAGLSPLSSFERGSDWEIISGATITSNGISNMITAGSKVIKAYADSHKAE